MENQIYDAGQNIKPKKKHSFLKFLGLLLAAAVFGLVAGSAFWSINIISDRLKGLSGQATEEKASEAINETITQEGTPLTTPVPEISAERLSVSTGDVSAVVKVGLPSIVSINTVTESTLYNFWGIPSTSESTASGSGFLIGQDSNELLIATNNHVISGAKTIEVTFCDGTTAEAEVKGADKYYDLAVISVKTKDLDSQTLNSIRIANLGNSDELAVGSLSIAIGNALGYGQSTTVGYISAIDREVTVDGITMTLIQTDAAINPGNSGGPLFNACGEVIGINSVKYSDTSVEGMGYAIPISRAIPIINELMNRTELTTSEKGYLGISGKDITTAYSMGFNLPVGVYVYEVYDDSAAQAAGIQAGDIITAVNGRTVTTGAELESVLAYNRAGGTISLTIKRRSHSGRFTTSNVNVTLGSMPEKVPEGSF